MEGRIWGYCRVSTAMQCEDRQLIALREYGVEEKRIVQDKKSGKNFDRPGYQRMLRALRRGDTVVFPSVDRMGRDYRLILEQWSRLMDRGVKIVVLDMPMDERSKGMFDLKDFDSYREDNRLESGKRRASRLALGYLFILC